MMITKQLVVMILFSFASAVFSFAEENSEYFDRDQELLDLYDKLPLSDNSDSTDYYLRPEYPYWPKPYPYQESPYGAIRMQKRRFFAFHPIARFRGIAMESGSSGSSGSGLGSGAYLGGHGRGRSFAPFAAPFMASPSHPVPADPENTLPLDNASNKNSADGAETSRSSPYFARMAPHRGSKGRDKISRFNVK